MENQQNGMEPMRLSEKHQLKDLNERFTAYVNAMRAKREKENQDSIFGGSTESYAKKLETQRQHYENEMFILQNELQNTKIEKSELESVRLKYEILSSEFEERISNLNETLRTQNDQMMKVQIEISNKDLQVEKLKSQVQLPTSQLETIKLEMDDVIKRYSETEKRCSTYGQEKQQMEAQLMDFQTRCSFDVQQYQQEISRLQERLEKSRELTLELEQALYKSGQQDDNVNQLIDQAREKSEMELRRYIDHTEMKHSNNISEIKLQIQSDSNKMTSIEDDNNTLQAHLNMMKCELTQNNMKLIDSQTQNDVLLATMESERKNSKNQTEKLEQKLQETQDLLLVKIQELTACQENYIPLQVEIENLKSLIEQEEKRLGMDGNASYHMIKSTTNHNTLSVDNQSVLSSSLPSLRHQTATTTTSSSNFNLYRPPTVPLVTDSFVRAPSGANPNELFQTGSSKVDDSCLMTSSDEKLIRNCELDRCRLRPGKNRLPSPPVGFTGSYGEKMELPEKLPVRPSSAANTQFVPAHAGEGRDYFESMFQDARKIAALNNNNSPTKPSSASGKESRKKKKSSTSLDLENTTGSATGNLKIVQVDEGGMFIRVHNTSAGRVEELGNCMLQQNVAGHPVAVFRFPPRTKLAAGHTATVWSAKSKIGVNDPPSHFLWKQLNKWGTGPECTTILCKPNGQAVAWITSAPRISRTARAYQHQSSSESSKRKETNEIQIESGMMESDTDDDCSRVAQYQPPTNLYQTSSFQPAPPTNGRQRPAAASTTSLCKPKSTNASMKVETTKSVTGGGGGGGRSLHLSTPGSFMSSRDQHKYALQWLRSNQNLLFNPPMPQAYRRTRPQYGAKPTASS